MTTPSVEARYRMGELKAKAAKYQVHICQDVDTGAQCLLQIASATEHNGSLDRAAFVLKELKQTSDSLEQKYARRHPGQELQYDRLFPKLLTSFVSEAQAGRRVNILDQQAGNSILEMVPLAHFRRRSQQRIDLPSSAWIMGRLLKLLGFVHPQGFSPQMLSGNNLLIDPEHHRLVVFDWSSAHTYVHDVPRLTKAHDIAKAAQAVLAAIGVDSRGVYPYITDENRQYVEFIQNLARNRHGDAQQAHHDFYEIVDELFGTGFRVFQSLPL